MRLAFVALLAVVICGIGGAAAPRAAAEAVEATATVEVTVWQSVLSGRIYLSTRPEGGDWRTHNRALDLTRLSESRRFYQGSAVEVDVPVEVSGEERTATVEVTVWWRVLNGAIYLSTRPRGGTWTTHNEALDMSQLSRSGRFYQGSAITVDVPVVVDEGSVEGDRAALVAFYYATDGPNWDNNHGWLSDSPLDYWYGVTTDDDGRVTELVLFVHNDDTEADPTGIGLRGAIPPELGNLTNLEVLDLTQNELSGAIPPELGNLTNLERLYLGRNQLSGAIPPELGNLTNLRVLDLAVNQLSGAIPPELGNLTNLEWLHLSLNQLSGAIPPELGNLANLLYLDLDSNQLSGAIPPELGDLAGLYGLYLDENQLSGEIPPELGNLTNLEDLQLSGNQLSGEIPPELGNLANLGQLYLRDNELSGCIPAALADVAYNDFRATGLPFCRN